MVYDISDKFLYEIIEDYQDADDIDKNDIFDAYMSAIWECDIGRRYKTKHIRFKVLKPMAGTALGDVFERHNSIPYKSYVWKLNSSNHIDFVRKKINNLYAYYADENMCTDDEYFEELARTKDLYYDCLDGLEITPEEAESTIQSSLRKAGAILAFNKKCKLKLPWEEYKKVIADFMWHIFNTYKPEQGIDDDGYINCVVDVTEDHKIVYYICKSLGGYMSNYQKKYYGVSRGNGEKYGRCKICGAMFVQNKKNNRKYCDSCKHERQLEYVRQSKAKSKKKLKNT